MIRDLPDDTRSAGRGGVWLWGLIIAALVLGCGILARRFGEDFGAQATFVFVGLGVAALVAALWIVLGSTGPRTPTHARVTDGLTEAFQFGPVPALITQDGKPVRANNAYMTLAENFGVLSASGSAPAVDQLFGSSDKDILSAIFRLHHLDDTERYAEESVSRRDKDGHLRSYTVHVTSFGRGHLWQIKDNTDEQSRLDSMLAQVPIGLFTVDQDGRILAANENLNKWIGSDEDGGSPPSHINAFIDSPDVLLGSPRTPGRVVRADTRLITRKGVVTPTVLVAAWREIEPDYFIANVALHGHSSLGHSGSRAQSPSNAGKSQDETASPPRSVMNAGDFAAAPFAILELDETDLARARIVRANSAFETMSGLRDWQDYPFRELFKPESAQIFIGRSALAFSADMPFDADLRGNDGLSVSAYIVGHPATQTCRVFMVDISARKSLEDQLIQSQKMQAIGRLVAEIAHDFNNLLAAMRLYTDTLLGRHPIGDPSYPELQQINSNVNRAASLVKKLLAYSRKQTLRAVRLDVTENLSEMAVTLEQVLGERVTLDIVHGRNLPPIKMDKSQLDTVLMNLAVNARDAMKAQGGGRITIQSQLMSKISVTSAGLRSALEPVKGDDVIVLSVKDTGTGITDEIKNKIFEPFFTTKAQGEGTGLGLSTVYGIMQQSGGHLGVQSELGVGTTFSIYLPVYEGLDADGAPAAAEPKPVKRERRPADLAGQGNILFVEDEDSVRIIAAKTLRKRGYNVVEACDGEEAYEILEDAETPFDLMISDVVMPGLDGPSLLKKARPLLGEARIVFISGYAEEEFSDLLSEEPDVTFLPKPFSLIELAEKVKSEIGVSDI